MANRAVSQVVMYRAWDTSTNTPKTGDVANHTLRWNKDGSASAPTNSPSEQDATNQPGIYKLTLTATETDCVEGTLAGKSSTANVFLFGPENIGFTTQATATDIWSAATRTLTSSGAVVFPGFKKNTAYTGFTFSMTRYGTDDPISGLVVTAQRSLDGGALASCANAVTEVGAGVYKIDLVAADLNANTVLLRFSSPAANTLDITEFPAP